MKSDNIDMSGPVPSWVYTIDTPPQVDDEPYPPSEELTATRNRDGLLLVVAVAVIVGILAWALGRASS
jgi:hypothetical protein